MGCSYEISSGENWGDCGKKSWQKCPDGMTEEELEAAEEHEDLRGDFKYEQQRDREMGI